MDITTIVNPRFYFAPGEPLLDMLIKFSQAHYDSTCKNASRPEGFLARWKAHVHAGVLLNEDAPRDVEATPRDLDLLMKICEVQRMVLAKGDEAALKQLNEFRQAVGEAMVKAGCWSRAPFVGMTDM